MSDQQVSSSGAHSLCVLLLEDDDADAYLTSLALRDTNRVSRIVHVSNGQEALIALEDGDVRPDIIIVDLHMPKMNGSAFMANCIERNRAAIPMIVLTSSSSVMDALQSYESGAVHLICKRERPGDLVHALHDAFNSFVQV